MRLQNSQHAEVYQRAYGTLKLFCGTTNGFMRTNKADFKALTIGPGEATSHHRHLVRESIFHVLQGRVRMRSESANFDHICIEGDTAIVEPGEDHCLYNVGESDAVVLEIESPPHASSDKIPWRAIRQGLGVPTKPKGRFWQSSPSVKVKICGVRNLESALECEALGVDAVGIHAIGQKGIEGVFTDSDWFKLIPEGLSVFLLTDQTDPGTLAELISATNCDAVQLQGPQNREQVRQVSEVVRGYGRYLVRTIGLPLGTPIETAQRQIAEILGISDAILIDSKSFGGTGTVHDWNVTEGIRDLVSKPLIIAGGLDAGNCGKAITQTRPWGIDVESGVERHFRLSDGRRVTVKDFKKIRVLVTAAHQARWQ